MSAGGKIVEQLEADGFLVFIVFAIRPAVAIGDDNKIRFGAPAILLDIIREYPEILMMMRRHLEHLEGLAKPPDDRPPNLLSGVEFRDLN